MGKTKLILLEGVPGSGKSTLAQFITHAFAREGIVCQWWYEEVKGHPLYVFHDLTSLQDTLNALSNGGYRAVIRDALKRWRKFAELVQTSEDVVILDGCLFGYLTWTLFPMDVSPDEIRQYLMQVEEIIKPLHPKLIYLYQRDLSAAMEKICARRGEDARKRFIDQATQSAYGKRRGFKDFGGMVAYWEDYCAFIDAVSSRFLISHLALENSAGDWSAYEQRALEFLSFPATTWPDIASNAFKRFVGLYTYKEDGSEHICEVKLEGTHCVVDGMPEVWQHTRLRPLSSAEFVVESLPIRVSFQEDEHGNVIQMKTEGPDMLFGSVSRLFTRVLDNPIVARLSPRH
ncbi:hypothetical protein [Ktedonospora formicarum]|uniref:Uncharacterized protein n=1 Tax=Ktedonospora formicarum TaxID=2778364 RepID=A0A8J3I574_9CHLR|nr:hypothetical protein [Ktedonospora formicarum]GHO46143.1 hypothetical protein KSX_43060 [Ktedonospora formicarum]